MKCGQGHRLRRIHSAWGFGITTFVITAFLLPEIQLFVLGQFRLDPGRFPALMWAGIALVLLFLGIRDFANGGAVRLIGRNYIAMGVGMLLGIGAAAVAASFV